MQQTKINFIAFIFIVDPISPFPFSLHSHSLHTVYGQKCAIVPKTKIVQEAGCHLKHNEGPVKKIYASQYLMNNLYFIMEQQQKWYQIIHLSTHCAHSVKGKNILLGRPLQSTDSKEKPMRWTLGMNRCKHCRQWRKKVCL